MRRTEEPIWAVDEDAKSDSADLKKYEIFGDLETDYNTFMLLCDGENSLASKNKDEILTDLIKKKEAWVATAEMERNEDNLNLLLAKIDVARKIIEHYSKP
jgi:hypothetical protein